MEQHENCISSDLENRVLDICNKIYGDIFFRIIENMLHRECTVDVGDYNSEMVQYLAVLS